MPRIGPRSGESGRGPRRRIAHASRRTEGPGSGRRGDRGGVRAAASAQDARKPAARPPATGRRRGPAARRRQPGRRTADPNDPRMKTTARRLGEAVGQAQDARRQDRPDRQVPGLGRRGVTRAGRILKSPEPRLPRLQEGRRRRQRQGKPKLVPHERIICTGNEVWQYQPRRQADLHLPARQEEPAAGPRGGPLAVPLQHEGGRGRGALRDGARQREQGRPTSSASCPA